MIGEGGSIILGYGHRRRIWIGDENINFWDLEHNECIKAHFINEHSLLINAYFPHKGIKDNFVKITPSIQIQCSKRPNIADDRYWKVFINTANIVLELYKSKKSQFGDLLPLNYILDIRSILEGGDVTEKYFKLVPKILKNLIHITGLTEYYMLFPELKYVPLLYFISGKNMEPARLVTKSFIYDHDETKDIYFVANNRIVNKVDFGLPLYSKYPPLWNTWSILAEYSVDNNEYILYKWIGDGLLEPIPGSVKINYPEEFIHIYESGWVLIKDKIIVKFTDTHGKIVDFQGYIPIMVLHPKDPFPQVLLPQGLWQSIIERFKNKKVKLDCQKLLAFTKSWMIPKKIAKFSIMRNISSIEINLGNTSITVPPKLIDCSDSLNYLDKHLEFFIKHSSLDYFMIIIYTAILSLSMLTYSVILYFFTQYYKAIFAAFVVLIGIIIYLLPEPKKYELIIKIKR